LEEGADPAEVEKPVIDEEYRALEQACLRLTTTAAMFSNDGLYSPSVNDIQNLHTLKMPRIIQSLMFLMQIDHDEICEPHSNRLFWKSARTRMNELFAQMQKY
jgi:hypothetical protein